MVKAQAKASSRYRGIGQNFSNHPESVARKTCIGMEEKKNISSGYFGPFIHLTPSSLCGCNLFHLGKLVEDIESAIGAASIGYDNFEIPCLAQKFWEGEFYDSCLVQSGNDNRYHIRHETLSRRKVV